jgi:hypothetical protein
MPHFDWTINLPLLLTLVSIAGGLAARAARLDERLVHLIETLKSHVAEDERRFEALDRDVHAARQLSHEYGNRSQAELTRLAVQQARLERRKGESRRDP